MSDILGLFLIGLFIILILSIGIYGNKKSIFVFRDISAFSKLLDAIGYSVETGKRIFIGLGYGKICSEKTVISLVSLRLFNKILKVGSISDLHPIATSGEASLSLLSQSLSKSSSISIYKKDNYYYEYGRLVGITPLSYSVGSIPIIYDEQSSLDILFGNFGTELGLVLEASERRKNLTLTGSDQITTTAIIYTMSQNPIIGEDLFAADAYLSDDFYPKASLYAQDIIRWILILIILIGSIVKFLGII